MRDSGSRLRAAQEIKPKAPLSRLEIHVTHYCDGPDSHVTARAPSRRENWLALCARGRRCLRSPLQEGEERRTAPVQRAAVTQCGTSLPNFPNLPGPEATVFLLGVVSSPRA
ncbi:hypothetical protein MC885_014308, partial [Smutsia gigantea]